MKFAGPIAYCLIFYSSYLLIVLSLPYITFEKNVDFLITKQLVYHIDWWRYAFYIHIFSSPIVILTGLVQFNHWSIKKWKKTHRVIGIIYVGFILFISGPSGFLLGLYANGSYPTQISFTLLSALWILFTYLAYRNARNGNYLTHSKWMIRSYSLTLSAVTLRFYAYLMDVWNVPLSPAETYIFLSYSSWIGNLILSEILIKLGFARYLLN